MILSRHTMEDQDGGAVVKRLSVPLGLEELMTSLTKEVLKKKPIDIYNFASEHFSQLLALRETGAYPTPPIRAATRYVHNVESGKIKQNIKGSRSSKRTDYSHPEQHKSKENISNTKLSKSLSNKQIIPFKELETTNKSLKNKRGLSKEDKGNELKKSISLSDINTSTKIKKTQPDVQIKPNKTFKRSHSYNRSILQKELQQVQQEAKFTSFTSSYNPYVLRKEVKAASKTEFVDSEVQKEEQSSNASNSKKIASLAAAATTIQSFWRGYSSRKNNCKTSSTNNSKENLKDSSISSKESILNRAIVTIQANVRGYLERKHLNAMKNESKLTSMMNQQDAFLKDDGNITSELGVEGDKFLNKELLNDIKEESDINFDISHMNHINGKIDDKITADLDFNNTLKTRDQVSLKVLNNTEEVNNENKQDVKEWKDNIIVSCDESVEQTDEKATLNIDNEESTSKSNMTHLQDALKSDTSKKKDTLVEESMSDDLKNTNINNIKNNSVSENNQLTDINEKEKLETICLDINNDAELLKESKTTITPLEEISLKNKSSLNALIENTISEKLEDDKSLILEDNCEKETILKNFIEQSAANHNFNIQEDVQIIKSTEKTNELNPEIESTNITETVQTTVVSDDDKANKKISDSNIFQNLENIEINPVLDMQETNILKLSNDKNLTVTTSIDEKINIEKDVEIKSGNSNFENEPLNIDKIEILSETTLCNNDNSNKNNIHAENTMLESKENDCNTDMNTSLLQQDSIFQDLNEIKSIKKTKEADIISPITETVKQESNMSTEKVINCESQNTVIEYESKINDEDITTIDKNMDIVNEIDVLEITNDKLNNVNKEISDDIEPHASTETLTINKIKEDIIKNQLNIEENLDPENLSNDIEKITSLLADNVNENKKSIDDDFNNNSEDNVIRITSKLIENEPLQTHVHKEETSTYQILNNTRNDEEIIDDPHKESLKSCISPKNDLFQKEVYENDYNKKDVEDETCKNDSLSNTENDFIENTQKDHIEIANNLDELENKLTTFNEVIEYETNKKQENFKEINNDQVTFNNIKVTENNSGQTIESIIPDNENNKIIDTTEVNKNVELIGDKNDILNQQVSHNTNQESTTFIEQDRTTSNNSEYINEIEKINIIETEKLPIDKIDENENKNSLEKANVRENNILIIKENDISDDRIPLNDIDLKVNQNMNELENVVKEEDISKINNESNIEQCASKIFLEQQSIAYLDDQSTEQKLEIILADSPLDNEIIQNQSLINKEFRIIDNINTTKDIHTTDMCDQIKRNSENLKTTLEPNDSIDSQKEYKNEETDNYNTDNINKEQHKSIEKDTVKTSQQDKEEQIEIKLLRNIEYDKEHSNDIDVKVADSSEIKEQEIGKEDEKEQSSNDNENCINSTVVDVVLSHSKSHDLDQQVEKNCTSTTLCDNEVAQNKDGIDLKKHVVKNIDTKTIEHKQIESEGYETQKQYLKEEKDIICTKNNQEIVVINTIKNMEENFQNSEDGTDKNKNLEILVLKGDTSNVENSKLVRSLSLESNQNSLKTDSITLTDKHNSEATQQKDEINLNNTCCNQNNEENVVSITTDNIKEKVQSSKDNIDNQESQDILIQTTNTAIFDPSQVVHSPSLENNHNCLKVEKYEQNNFNKDIAEENSSEISKSNLNYQTHQLSNFINSDNLNDYSDANGININPDKCKNQNEDAEFLNKNLDNPINDTIDSLDTRKSNTPNSHDEISLHEKNSDNNSQINNSENSLNEMTENKAEALEDYKNLKTNFENSDQLISNSKQSENLEHDIVSLDKCDNNVLSRNHFDNVENFQNQDSEINNEGNIHLEVPNDNVIVQMDTENVHSIDSSNQEISAAATSVTPDSDVTVIHNINSPIEHEVEELLEDVPTKQDKSDLSKLSEIKDDGISSPISEFDHSKKTNLPEGFYASKHNSPELISLDTIEPPIESIEIENVENTNEVHDIKNLQNVEQFFHSGEFHDAGILPLLKSHSKDGIISNVLGRVADQQLAIASPRATKAEVEPEKPNYIHIPLKEPPIEEMNQEVNVTENGSKLNVENKLDNSTENPVEIHNTDTLQDLKNLPNREGTLPKALGVVLDQQLAIATPTAKIEENMANKTESKVEYIRIPLKDDEENSQVPESELEEKLKKSNDEKSHSNLQERGSGEIRSADYEHSSVDIHNVPLSNMASVPLQVQHNQVPGAEILTSPMVSDENIINESSEEEIAQTSKEDVSLSDREKPAKNGAHFQSGMAEPNKQDNAPLVQTMENVAATKIQASFRGYQVRKQLKPKNGGVDSITQRRSLRRKSSGKLRGSENLSQQRQLKSSDIEEKSATKIQAGVRGFLVRRRQSKIKNTSPISLK